MHASSVSWVAVVLFGLAVSNPGLAGERRTTPAEEPPAVAGARSSKYGIRPFPAPHEWVRALQSIEGRFPGSQAYGIWIVGALHERRGCQLEFPQSAGAPPEVSFLDYDKHEPYLTAFDEAGVRVFLQVEPGMAEPDALIDLVLERYGRHPSVVGFGIDVEWYREAQHPEWGEKVDDATAARWEARVKSHDPAFRLFLKHWDPGWMPPRYRGDIVFVDDSQALPDLDSMAEEFAVWGRTFAPNDVYFQIGYEADGPWWRSLDDPIRDVGGEICSRIRQTCGIFWVDFTLREVLPDELAIPGAADSQYIPSRGERD